MAAKFHEWDGLRSPLVLNSATVGDQLHHALVRIDACEPRARVSSWQFTRPLSGLDVAHGVDTA